MSPTLSPSQNLFPEPRPTFFSIEYRRIGEFPAEVISERYGNQSAGSNFNEKIRVKLNAPLLLKNKFKLFLGLRYSQEEFHFEDYTKGDEPLHYRLDDRNLYSVGYRLFFSADLENDWSMTGGMGADLNGDKVSFSNFSQYLRHNYFALAQKKVNSRTQWGFGAAFGYDMGRPSVYPILRYSKQFNSRWSFDMYLPKSIQVTRAFSPKTYLVANTKISGASYCLTQNLLEDIPKAEFRESHVEMSLELQREIHDWLWFSVKAGGLKTLNMRVNEPGTRSRDFLLRVRSVEAPFVNFSVYLVPPRSLLKKNL